VMKYVSIAHRQLPGSVCTQTGPWTSLQVPMRLDSLQMILWQVVMAEFRGKGMKHVVIAIATSQHVTCNSIVKQGSHQTYNSLCYHSLHQYNHGYLQKPFPTVFQLLVDSNGLKLLMLTETISIFPWSAHAFVPAAYRPLEPLMSIMA
jgi:hypothetical protein